MKGPAWVVRRVRFFRDLSLRKKTIAVIVGTSLVVICLSTLATFLLELKFTRDQLRHEHRTAARLIAKNLEVPFAFSLFAASTDAEETLGSLASIPTVVQAVAIAADGSTLAHYRRKGEEATPELTLLTPERFDWRVLIVAEPVIVQGEVAGRLVIQADLDDLYAVAMRRFWMFLFLFVVALGVAFILASKMGGLVSRPILELAATAQRISRDKDFSRRHERVYNDETGRLVDAFNAMMVEIQSNQELVRDNAERFRRYFDLGIVGMGILDSRMHWREANERMAEITGYSFDRLRERPFQELLRKDRPESEKNQLDDLLSGRVDRFSGECWLRGAEDRRIFVMVSLCRVERTRAHPQHFIVLVQDITERKATEENLLRAKEAAEASNRAKDEFLSIMSHELRTPLNPIIGFGELLQDELQGEDHRSFLDVMMRSAQHLLELIDNILNYVRIERRPIEATDDLIDYRTVFEDAVDFLRGTAADRGLALCIEHVVEGADLAGGDVFLLNLPGTPLRQLALNLLGNALKFTDEGSVTLKSILRLEDEHHARLRVEVADTGIGIPEDQRERIFDAFTQLDESLTRNYGGIGLGLAICRKIVHALGGAIGVASEVGNGSLFWFEIPVSYHVASFRRDGFVVDGEGARPVVDAAVLLVEDDESNRAVAEAVLRRCGVSVCCAENGTEALQRWREQPFRLILMDIQMPGMNGFEATRQIREAENGTGIRIPIVGVTAHAGGLTEEACRESGMDDFLAKPFRASDLEKTVRRWLDENVA